jgi:hypothetical protein
MEPPLTAVYDANILRHSGPFWFLAYNKSRWPVYPRLPSVVFD